MGGRVLLAILTRDRPVLLRRCLDSVAAAEAPEAEALSVLVVDDGSAPEVARRVREMVGERVGPHPAEVVDGPARGIAAARNRALEAAVGQDALIFLDDDQTIPPDFFATLLRVWREEGCEVVKPVIRWEFEPPGRYRDFFEKEEPEAPRTPARRVASNGVLIDRRVWGELGVRFDEGYGFAGGSDTRFFHEAATAGARAVRTRETYAVEYCHAARQRRAYILRRSFQIGANESSMRMKPHSRAYFAASGLLRALWGALLSVAFLWRPERALRFASRSAKGLGRTAGVLGVRIPVYRRIVGR